MDEVEPAPLWWVKFWRMLAALVCEVLWMVNIPMPTARLREEYGSLADLWCCFVHSSLETYVWELEGCPSDKASNKPQEGTTSK